MMESSAYKALVSFHTKPKEEAGLGAWRKDYAWATKIIQERFQHGIDDQFSEKRIKKAFDQFNRTKDPIYHALLQGMGDESLARAFVTYWKSGQALATRSRFWLERAMVELLVNQVLKYHNCDMEVYTNAMLRSGMLKKRKPVAELGAQGVLEYQAPQGVWQVEIKTELLDQVDKLVAQQERVPLLPTEPSERLEAQRKADAALSEADKQAVHALRKSVTGNAVSTIPIRCNLIVVDPNKVHGTTMVNAMRIINPRTFDKPADRKQERTNVLRLYAYLIQEMPDIDPRAIRVRVAELLPRHSHFENLDHYPQYFSDMTYWTAIEMWRFIGVPLPIVSEAIESAASALRDNLTKQLKVVLPGSDASKAAKG